MSRGWGNTLLSEPMMAEFADVYRVTWPQWVDIPLYKILQ